MGVGTVSSLVTLVSIIDAGVNEALLADLSDAQRDTVACQFDSLISTPTPLHLLGAGEHAIIIASHVILSVPVWMVLTGRIRRWWIFRTILAYILADVGAALYQSGAVSVFVAQGRVPTVIVTLVLTIR